jgi:hypothetical protein
MKPSTSSNNAARGSKIDGKLAASQTLLSYPRVLTSLGNIMSRAVEDSKNGKDRTLHKEMGLVQRSHDKLALDMYQNTKAASNVAGAALEYTVRTMEVQERRAMSLQGIRGDAAVDRQIVRNFLFKKPKSVQVRQIAPRHKRKIEYSEPDGRGKKKMPKRLEVVYPLPENRREYLPLEAVTYLQSLRDGSIRSATMQEWIDKRLVPVKNKQTFYQLLKKLNNRDVIPSIWGKIGRTRLVGMDAIPRLVSALDGHQGLSMSTEDVETAIMRARKENIEERGLKPLGEGTKVSKASLTNYMALIHATVDGISAVETAIPKTNSRYTAEHSLMAAVSLLLTVATTFFYPTPPSIIPRSDDRNTVMTDGAAKLKELVSEALGGLPLSCVQPEFMTSTDDTVAYVFAGTQPKGGSMWKLVKTADLEGRDCRSIYQKVDSQSNMCGFRIKLTFTFNAAGQMAPLFISVTGLSEKELPSETCPSGMLVMKVKGLAIGANVNVDCESVGYVVFLRKSDTNELDTRRFTYYRDEVYLPFIETIRKSMGYEPGTPVPEVLTVVSSQDGDAEQRRVLTDENRDVHYYERLA